MKHQQINCLREIFRLLLLHIHQTDVIVAIFLDQSSSDTFLRQTRKEIRRRFLAVGRRTLVASAYSNQLIGISVAGRRWKVGICEKTKI